MASRSFSSSSYLSPMAFHMFYKYTRYNIYNREWKKEEQTITEWGSPKAEEESSFGTFLAFCASVAIASVYPNEIPTQLPGTLTHPLALTGLASGSTCPNSSLQQPPLSDRRLSLTVGNSYLLTALGPSLSSSSSGLVGNLARKPFVRFAPKQIKEPSDWRSSTLTPTERMLTIMPQS